MDHEDKRKTLIVINYFQFCNSYTNNTTNTQFNIHQNNNNIHK